jgi:hypothetical protein
MNTITVKGVVYELLSFDDFLEYHYRHNLN